MNRFITITVVAPLLFYCTAIFAADQLVFAADIMRHGDRTPIHDISIPPYVWPQGLGQLTSLGKEQELQLGQRLRKIYMQQESFLPNFYQENTLMVWSTDYPRTIMSAQAFLQGLYPGEGQTIPVHIVSASRVNNKALYKKYVFPSKDWQAFNKKLAPQYPAWRRATGMNIQSLYGVISLGDALYIRQIHHIPLPESLSQPTVNTIIDARSWAFARLFKSSQVSCPLVSNLLINLHKNFLLASQKNMQLKYMLFSGHDSTILSMLSVLGTHQFKEVPYASDLNFKMFKTSQGQYVISILFNGQPVDLAACGNSNRCTLAQFNALVSPCITMSSTFS